MSSVIPVYRRHRLFPVENIPDYPPPAAGSRPRG